MKQERLVLHFLRDCQDSESSLLHDHPSQQIAKRVILLEDAVRRR